MTLTMSILFVVPGVRSLAVDTQTGDVFFSKSTTVKTVGKTPYDDRVIVKVDNNIYGITVDPVLR